MLVLDTDHLSLMEWNQCLARKTLLQRLSAVSPDEVFTTVVTYEGLQPRARPAGGRLDGVRLKLRNPN